jgi:hypothetical protein
VGLIERFASVTSTLEMLGRPGRSESGAALSRLFLHCIDGKKMWGKKMGLARKEVGVAISPDPIFIFLPNIFLPPRRSLIALEDARQELPTDGHRSTQM